MKQTLLLNSIESVKKGVGWVGKNKNRYDIIDATHAGHMIVTLEYSNHVSLE